MADFSVEAALNNKKYVAMIGIEHQATGVQNLLVLLIKTIRLLEYRYFSNDVRKFGPE